MIKRNYFSIFFVFFTLVFLSCDLELEDDPISTTITNSEIIKIETISIDNQQSYKIAADSVSSLIIKVTLESKIQAPQTITISSQYGILTKLGEVPTANHSNKITLESEYRELYVQLHSDDIPRNTFLVTASAGGFTNSTSVSFLKSDPDVIQIGHVPQANSTTDTLSLNFNTLKRNGVISKGADYYISIQNLDTMNISSIPNKFGTFKKGVNQIKIINTNKKRGSALVKIYTINNQQVEISDQTIIRY